MAEQRRQTPQVNRSLSQVPDLRWLVRYARHCGFHVDAEGGIEQALRSAFGAPAWRIICRSHKRTFLPILRNRELSIHSLITYCRRLAVHSFVLAPQPILLAFFTNQRRAFFNRTCRIPEPEDYELMRVANRERSLRLRDIAVVANWVHQERTQIQPSHRWSSLVIRAGEYFEGLGIRVQFEDQEPWHFFCGHVLWRSFRIEPIREPVGLWKQGQRQGNCLYKLRFECGALKPSRFFAVYRGGRLLATLELAWRPPQRCDRGMDRLWGHWFLQDLRLAFNRLPDEALLNAMQDFACQYNTWAKRPRRQTPEQISETLERVSRTQDSGNACGWVPSFAG